MIDVLGQSCFQDIRKCQGFEQAVLAGGFVRDCVNRVMYKDIDIFVPCKSQKDFIRKVLVARESDRFTIDQGYDDNHYRDVSPYYLGKYDAKYSGFMECDIIGYELPEKDFGENLIKQFQWGIDMIYFDGDIHASKEFERDIDFGTLTLMSVPNLNFLPAAFRKYERLKQKYPNFRFDTKLKIEGLT